MSLDRRWRSVLHVAGAALAVATAVFVAIEIARQWDAITQIVRDANPWWLVTSTVVFVIAEAAYARAWPATLHRVGYAVPPLTGSATFLVTQSAKFVPGSVWHAVGRVGTADRLGVPKRVVGGAMALEMSASVAAAVVVAGGGGALAPFVFDQVGALQRAVELVVAALAACAVALGGRRVAGRVAGRNLLRGRAFVAILLWHVAVWVGYGVAAGLLSAGLGAPFLPTIGAFSLAWVAGFLVVGAPAGLGVREAVMTAALTPTAGADVALAVAIGSRALWTLVQLGGAALAVPYLARRGQWVVPPDTGSPPDTATPPGTATAGDPPNILC